MKKTISIMSVFLAIVFCIVPTTALASNSTEDDTYFTQKEFEMLNPNLCRV